MNCYNGEKYLPQALQSIINQSYKNWELIFWDNQSNDKTKEIFESFNDKRFKYFYSPSHTLLYEARNSALKKTTGEFVAILDADDWWAPEKLEMQLPLFKDKNVGLVYGNLWVFNQKTNKKKIFSNRKLPTGHVIDKILSDYKIGLGTIVLRKKYLESLNYPFDQDFHIIGDFDLSIRMALICKFECIQKPISYFRVHDKNESFLRKNKEIPELKNLYKKMIKIPILSSQDRLNKINLKILYLEIEQSISKHRFIESILMILKFPLSLSKIKLIVVLLTPNFILKRFKYWVI
jgi:glycosyltransferase involved in cell wall biosynthesis